MEEEVYRVKKKKGLADAPRGGKTGKGNGKTLSTKMRRKRKKK